MKVMAINGSPRKKWNTATLLSKALEGAASQGAETELIHLYDLDYKGCISCFSCKLKDGKNYGRCAVKDDLTLVLQKVEESGAIILGSPIYLGVATGQMRSFLERLVFPYLVYDLNRSSLCKRQIRTGFIYTMGADEDQMKQMGFDQPLKLTETMLRAIFGASETLLVTDTYQFDDYSKYVAPRFDPEQKAKRREEVFPQDCQKAFEMGARLAQ